MIERVLLDGVDVALTDVFAAVTIRHGRGSADDGPLASTCSLTLKNVTRALSLSFRVAGTLDVLLAGDVPRFRGRITDADLSDDGLSVIAVSSLSWLSNRPVGTVDWPSETWSERVERAFLEAGYAVTWATFDTETWATFDPSSTWAAPIEEPPVTIEVGDANPVLAARPAASVTLAQYLGELAETEPAAIANLPNGNVIVQALTARKAIAALELDPLDVAYAPEWSQVDDVENVIEVEWAGGTVTASDYASMTRHEPRPKKLTTDLATEADAQLLADLRLVRRSNADWLVEQADLLALDPAIGIGSPVVIPGLPAWAPTAAYLGMVEGWEDHVEADEVEGLEWTTRLTLSAPRLSGYGLRWIEIDPAIAWADVDPSTWFSPTI